jgi:hypothetical protein
MNTTPKTRLYLDFDGVVNVDAPAHNWEYSAVRQTSVTVNSQTYILRWAEDLVKALKELPVELVWTTTWTNYAPKFLGPALGYGSDSRFLQPLNGRLDYPTINWKQEAVIADQMSSPSPFLWVDDEMTGVQTKTVRELFGGRGLTFTTFSGYGITPEMVADMRLFAEEQNSIQEVP